jgi:hypothetical protein
MALIYKLLFPNPAVFGNFQASISPDTNNRNMLPFDFNLFRPDPLGLGQTPNRNVFWIAPTGDVKSKDFKVSTKLEEINSKITYDLSFGGETARLIIRYLKSIRFPLLPEDSPRVQKDIEYLFNEGKDIMIQVFDNCCGTEPKLIVEGYIPLNSIRYCEDSCSVNFTIYEAGDRTSALDCLSSTVLGIKNNWTLTQVSGFEILSDFNHKIQTGIETVTKFANKTAKWFDVCIEPTSPGLITILLNFLGWQKIMLALFFLPIIAAIAALILVINGIIAAINIIPGVNVTPITNIVNGDSGPLALFDDLFGLERLVEGLYGCRYVRGGYRVATVITSACAACGLVKSSGVGGTVSATDVFNEAQATAIMADKELAITANPFVVNGAMNGPLLNNKIDTYNTVYMPAEEAYKRRKEKKTQRGSGDDILGRAASIETADKIFNRLSSLWGNTWNVVNIPFTRGTLDNRIQLQLGPNESRYAFRKEDFVNIPEMKICYTVGDKPHVGYSTTWQQDSSDTPANKQSAHHNGYLSYYTGSARGRQSNGIKDYPVDFAPAHYIASLKDDSLYDDLRANRTVIVGFTQLRDFFVTGTLIQGTEFTSVPKLIQFKVENTNVLDYGRTCRVANYNSSFGGAYRMSSEIYTEVDIATADEAFLKGIPNSPATPITGIQSVIPKYSAGYFGNNNVITGVSDARISNLIDDYLKKYGSDEVGYDEARQRVRNANPSFLGPFTNALQFQTIADNPGYKFVPLMDFTVELDNYTCGQDDLFNQCITSAVLLTPTPGIDDVTINFKLRLVKLSLGLGVLTELEIDYENRSIKGSGYVIPFVQNGIDYSV